MWAVAATRTMQNARPKFRAENDDVRVKVIYPREKPKLRIVEPVALPQPVNPNTSKAALQMKANPCRHRTELDRIVWRICYALGVHRAHVTGRSRVRHVVFARQAIFYYAARRTDLTLYQISMKLGGFDHTTVMHGMTIYPKKRAAMGRHLPPVR
jgi:hypothetical protein